MLIRTAATTLALVLNSLAILAEENPPGYDSASLPKGTDYTLSLHDALPI